MRAESNKPASWSVEATALTARNACCSGGGVVSFLKEDSLIAAEDIKRKLQHRPFVPFRIVLTDGAVYEVRHPELLLLGKRSLVIGLTGDPDDTVYDRYVTVALLHITRIEPSQPTAVS